MELTPEILAFTRRVVHADRMFVVAFTPVLVVIFLRLCWRAWEKIQKANL